MFEKYPWCIRLHGLFFLAQSVNMGYTEYRKM